MMPHRGEPYWDGTGAASTIQKRIELTLGRLVIVASGRPERANALDRPGHTLEGPSDMVTGLLMRADCAFNRCDPRQHNRCDAQASSRGPRSFAAAAVMALRYAERDLAKVADLAVLTKLPADNQSSCTDRINAALASVRAALAVIDGGGMAI
jgi:hypothetical protein